MARRRFEGCCSIGDTSLASFRASTSWSRRTCCTSGRTVRSSPKCWIAPWPTTASALIADPGRVGREEFLNALEPLGLRVVSRTRAPFRGGEGATDHYDLRGGSRGLMHWAMQSAAVFDPLRSLCVVPIGIGVSAGVGDDVTATEYWMKRGSRGIAGDQAHRFAVAALALAGHGRRCSAPSRRRGVRLGCGLQRSTARGSASASRPATRRFSLSPTFAAAAPGGPGHSPLEAARGSHAPNGDPINREVPFVGDSRRAVVRGSDRRRVRPCSPSPSRRSIHRAPSRTPAFRN